MNGLIQNAISFENEKGVSKNQLIIDNLTQLQTYRKIILNIGSHYSDEIIYKRELEEVMKKVVILHQAIEEVNE